MTRVPLALSIALAALSSAAPSAAATVDLNFDFSATDFYAVRGGGALPVPTLVGAIVLSFDDATDIAPTGDGLTATGFNFAPGPLLYAYDKGNDVLRIGTQNAHQEQYDDAFLSFFLKPGSGPSSLSNVAYSVGDYSIWVARTVTVTDPMAVPEPGAWALMVLGFGGLGAALRRRRTIVPA